MNERVDIENIKDLFGSMQCEGESGEEIILNEDKNRDSNNYLRDEQILIDIDHPSVLANDFIPKELLNRREDLLEIQTEHIQFRQRKIFEERTLFLQIGIKIAFLKD